jgi:hypothetical protein
MSEEPNGALPPDASGNGNDTILIDVRGLESARRVAQQGTDDKSPLTAVERAQLAREIADIEEAATALRKAQPALKSWSKPQVPTATPKARPLWLLIGVLWLSTALVTAGAAVAIHSFAG